MKGQRGKMNVSHRKTMPLAAVKKPSDKLGTFPAGSFLEFRLALNVHLAEAL